MRSLFTVQKKQIQKEIKKDTKIISDKIVVYKNVNEIPKHSLGNLIT